MSKITIYEVQERMPRMETLVELWEASVRATHHFPSLIGASFATTSIRISLSRISTRAGPLETFDCCNIIFSGIILRFAPCFLSLGNIRKRIWKKADGDVFD